MSRNHWAERNIPNPGSAAALDLGCFCAVIDNHYGAGVPWGDNETTFWITQGCPVHCPIVDTAPL